jgi:hypothetical protein
MNVTYYKPIAPILYSGEKKASVFCDLIRVTELVADNSNKVWEGTPTRAKWS